MLVQLYAVAPLFSPRFIAYAHVVRCTGDHDRCGCSPGRIASRTCCCYQSKRLGFFKPVAGGCGHGPEEARPAAAVARDDAGHDCCDAANGRGNVTQRDDRGDDPGSTGKPCCAATAPAKAELPARDGQGRPIPCICTAPCGGDPAFSPASLETVKFLGPAVRRFVPAAFSPEYPRPPRDACQGRSPEPPDPPPRLSCIS